jgi:hypothetical protein
MKRDFGNSPSKPDSTKGIYLPFYSGRFSKDASEDISGTKSDAF